MSAVFTLTIDPALLHPDIVAEYGFIELKQAEQYVDTFAIVASFNMPIRFTSNQAIQVPLTANTGNSFFEIKLFNRLGQVFATFIQMPEADAQLQDLPFFNSSYSFNLGLDDLNGMPKEYREGSFLRSGIDSATWDNISKTDIGLSNVDNTSDSEKPISTATQQAINSLSNSTSQALALKLDNSKAGAINGLATLDSTGILTEAQIKNTGVTSNTYGSSIAVGTFNVDTKGRITSAATTTIRSATTAQTGVVQLNSTTNSTSTTLAATPSAVKSAYDLASAAIPASQKGVANGVATLDVNGIIQSSQLPSYVDDILEFSKQSAFPVTGESGKIYVTADTNMTYRWTGTAYVTVGAGSGVSDTAVKLYTPRTIAMTGDGAWSVNFDGSNNVTAALTLSSTGVSSGSYGTSIDIPSITIDEKGRITAATTNTIRAATTAQTGIVQLNNTTTSTSTVQAATANAVKVTYDLASTKFPTAGGTMTGSLSVQGSITATGNVTAYSDRRLKKDLEQITNALDKVKQLTGYNYTRIDSGERHTGMIAQDIEKVLPEAVINGEEFKSVAYGNMMGLIVEAIKDLSIRLDKLEVK